VHNSDKSLHGTLTRNRSFLHGKRLFDQIEERIKKNESHEDLDEELYGYLQEGRFDPENLDPSEFNRSFGYQPGSYVIHNFEVRPYLFESIKEAELEVQVNNHVDSFNPGKTPFSISIKEYFLSRNFEGKHLVHAPLRLLLSHINFVMEVSHSQVPGLELEPEQYLGKFCDQTRRILDQKYGLSKETKTQMTDFADNILIPNTKFPDYDFYPIGNEKFNEEDEVNCFDWKDAKTAVPYLYNAVRTTHCFDGEVHDALVDRALKAWETQGLGDANKFNYFWEVGSLYFLSREMYNSITSGDYVDEERLELFKRRILRQEFKNINLGNLLKKDIRGELSARAYS